MDTDQASNSSESVSVGGVKVMDPSAKKTNSSMLHKIVIAVLALSVVGLIGVVALVSGDSDNQARRDSASTQVGIDQAPLAANVAPISTLELTSDPMAAVNIGVVGCSNTGQHSEGYRRQSDLDKFWPVVRNDIGSGTITRWADDIGKNGSKWWGAFDRYNAAEPADTVWMQICVHSTEITTNQMTTELQDDVTAVIAQIQAKTNGAVVYISPLNSYVNNDCSGTGPYGVEVATQLADWAVAEGYAFRGPDTGPLGPGDVVQDMCHLSASGQALVGDQMVAFFDNGEVPVPDPDPNPDPDPDPDPDPNPNPDPDQEPEPSTVQINMLFGESKLYQGTAKEFRVEVVGLQEGAVFTVSGSGVTLASGGSYKTTNSANIFRIKLVAEADTAIGNRDLTVTNPDGSTFKLSNALEIVVSL